MALKRRTKGVIAGLVIAAVIVAILFTVPYSHSYSNSLAGPGEQQLPGPHGSKETVSWVALYARFASVEILNGQTFESAAVVNGSWAASGEYSFTVNSGNYYIHVTDPGYGVTYHVTYSAPLL